MRKIRLTERKLGGKCGGVARGGGGGTWCEGGNHRSGLYCSHVGYCKASPDSTITTSAGGGKTKYPKEASKFITMKESDLINIIRRMVNEAEKKPNNSTYPKPPKSRGKIGPGGGKQKMAPAPATPAAAPPPCVPPAGPGGNGLGLWTNASGANLGNGCCQKCNNPNFTAANDPICAPHCGCC